MVTKPGGRLVDRLYLMRVRSLNRIGALGPLWIAEPYDECPAGRRGVTHEPLLDRPHLETQTAGDDALAQELLALFCEQCRRLLPGIRDAGGDTGDRADLAHTLKGSALGVGAMRVAALAAAVEDGLRSGNDVDREPMQALDDAVGATLSEIDAPG